ncbi:MAG TPA: hypothetical protein VGG13_03545 [Candidatus Saccharimonadales bacterium]
MSFGQGIEPRRKLAVDFTNQTMQRIAVEITQRPSLADRFASHMKGLSMKFLPLKRAGLIGGVTAAILIGGTGFAALRWAGFSGVSDYTNVTKLANGNIRFMVQTKSNDASGYSAKDNQCGDTNGQYFEIKAGANLTPAQVADMVAGSCEYTDITGLFPGVAIGGTWPSGIPENSTGYAAAKASPQINPQYYLVSGTAKQISATAITVVLSNFKGNQTQTLPLSSSLRLYDNGQPIALSDLKVGGSLDLLLRAQATYWQVDKLSLNWQNPNETLPNSLVYGINKLHHAAYAFNEEGKAFTPLVPPANSTAQQAVADYKNPARLVQEYPLR